MIPREITSLQHPVVKRMVKLREDRAFREKEKSGLIVGKKLVLELSSFIKTLVTTKEFSDVQAKDHLIVTLDILKKISGMPSPEGMAAEVHLPENASLVGKKYLIALDEVSDPGNLGTLLRTALALGWEGAFLTPSSVDPFNDKAIRAAKGASFRLPLCRGSWQEFDALASHRHVYVADAKGKPLETVELQEPMILILGNESRGLSDHAKKRGIPIAIPIQKMESLNVAVAGGILMYRMKHG